MKTFKEHQRQIVNEIKAKDSENQKAEFLASILFSILEVLIEIRDSK
jgi:hypothetical protein